MKFSKRNFLYGVGIVFALLILFTFVIAPISLTVSAIPETSGGFPAEYVLQTINNSNAVGKASFKMEKAIRSTNWAGLEQWELVFSIYDHGTGKIRYSSLKLLVPEEEVEIVHVKGLINPYVVITKIEDRSSNPYSPFHLKFEFPENTNAIEYQ